MKKEKIKILAVPMIYALAIITFILSVYLIEKVVNNTIFKDIDSETQYVDEEIVNINEYIPVINIDTSILKPFLGETIQVNKKFYNHNSEESQEDAIIYYEGTYMQNTGIDYISENNFDVVTILDGTVINVENNEILGNTIEIRHDNDLISQYQCVSDIKVKIDDTVLRGQVIASSGTCNLYNKGNNIHFELYHNGLIVNPELYYDKDINDIQ